MYKHVKGEELTKSCIKPLADDRSPDRDGYDLAHTPNSGVERIVGQLKHKEYSLDHEVTFEQKDHKTDAKCQRRR